MVYSNKFEHLGSEHLLYGHYLTQLGEETNLTNQFTQYIRV
jgi:hypothetical protein